MGVRSRRSLICNGGKVVFWPWWTQVINCSDGEVKHSEPMKLSNQLCREKVHYSKLFKTVYAVVI